MSYEKNNIALNGDLITKDDFKEKETSLNSQILGFKANVFSHQILGFPLLSNLYTAALGLWDFCYI